MHGQKNIKLSICPFETAILQFNVSGPYEDYNVSVKCIFIYGGCIVSVQYIFPKCPINAALSNSSPQFVVYTRVQVSDTKTLESLRLGTERMFVVWETCPCWMRRISLDSPQLCPVNCRAKPWLDGNMQRENGVRSGQWWRHISQHTQVQYRQTDRQTFNVTLPHCVVLLSVQLSLHILLMFADSQCLASAYPKIISGIPAFGLQVTTPSSVQPFGLQVTTPSGVQPFRLHVLSIPTWT